MNTTLNAIGFQIYTESTFPFFHWLCWSSLQQCCDRPTGNFRR